MLNDDKTMREATKKDFFAGNTLFNQYGGWTIKNHYTQGVWEARGDSGDKCIFEREAKFYTVNK